MVMTPFRGPVVPEFHTFGAVNDFFICQLVITKYQSFFDQRRVPSIKAGIFSSIFRRILDLTKIPTVLLQFSIRKEIL